MGSHEILHEFYYYVARGWTKKLKDFMWFLLVKVAQETTEKTRTVDWGFEKLQKTDFGDDALEPNWKKCANSTEPRKKNTTLTFPYTGS